MQGKNINGYALQQQLGVGGMAEVWLAENAIGKKAAVKLLLPKFCQDEAIVARFENEAKVMVQLDHPNIRQVYDYGNIDGRPTIIMEYLEGDDLKAFMKQGRCFSDEELARWWNQMVQALNYTHSLGVVHRDIKPSNIFIDKRGNVKLLDFGIAKNSDGGSGTLTGSTLGTRIYMSPEQVKDPKRVDYRTDLYSLAVTFVHLLTGKAPYDSTTSSDFEIQMDIVMKPLDLSVIPLQWQSLLGPYLEKTPEKRPKLQLFEAPNLETTVRIVEKISDEETIVGDQLEERALDSNDLKITFTANNGYDDKISFVMKWIEGGSFNMGANNNLLKNKDSNYDPYADSDESPVHGVSLDGFYLGELEVTNQLYDAVEGYDTTVNPSMPKSNLSWNDCQELIRKLNVLTGRHFRLPTEAEWEYAARGGKLGHGYYFSGSNDFNEIAWTAENSDYKAHPVGLKMPNELGLYDMSGSVGEWCEDKYGDYSKDNQFNPQGVSSGNYRVLRGGCWGYVSQRCRVSNREYANPDSRSSVYGLRLALSK